MLESFKSGKFEYKRLTEAEQQSRGILGRLKGVIADTTNSTRNGRKYSSELWENVFNNDVMKEKIANRCCFGELGHPADREEVDMEKIAICLAEQPKIGDDGKIYGVFDILSTPNGRILKSLCDYGCNVGVSSRGTGDLYTDDEGNEAVDPETYNCECWDAVLVPAVKEARLQYVSESLNKTRYNKSLKTVLQESLEKANDEDRKVMKEALDDLGIKLNEDSIDDVGVSHAKAELISQKRANDKFKCAGHEVLGKDLLDYFDPDEELTISHDNVIVNRKNEAIHPELKDKKPIKGDEPFTSKVDPDAVKKVFEIFDSMSEEDFNAFNDAAINAYAPLEKDDNYKQAKLTINKLLRKYHLPAWALKAFAENWDEQYLHEAVEDRYAEFNPEDAELHKNTDWKARNYEDLPVPEDSFENDVFYYKHGEKPEQKTTKFIKYIRSNPIYPPYYAPEEKPFDDGALGPMYNGNFYNMYDIHDRYEDQETYDRMSESYMNERLISTLRDSQGVNEECNNESCADKDAEEVVNDKSSELVAELQEALLKIKELEDDNLSLQERLSVCNAKENELTEQLGKYKQATVNLSETAKQAKSLNEEKAKLTEDLNKQANITSLNKARLQSLITAKKDLTAQLTEAKAEITKLSDEVKVVNEELENKSKQLDGSKSTLEKYRKNYAALKESYIESKAANYGLTKSEIKNKLNESFSLSDLDSVCKEMSTEKNRLSKLPFVINENTNISVKKSKNEYIMNESLNMNSDDYISDSLLQLANLK